MAILEYLTAVNNGHVSICFIDQINLWMMGQLFIKAISPLWWPFVHWCEYCNLAGVLYSVNPFTPSLWFLLTSLKIRKGRPHPCPSPKSLVSAYIIKNKMQATFHPRSPKKSLVSANILKIEGRQVGSTFFQIDLVGLKI